MKRIAEEEIDLINRQVERKDSHNTRHFTGRHDMAGTPVYEGDILESHLDGKINALKLTVCYGTYQAYCPVDDAFMDNVGFYIEGANLPPMPLGPLEEYALVVSHCETEFKLEE